MAIKATVYHWPVTLSDVDRGVYEALDLRLARQPSESMRYLLTRAIAYCLCYEEGIGFSKEGIASTDEPPLAVRDGSGTIRTWIEIGAPSAERLHKAGKASPRVALFTHVELPTLWREARTKPIYNVEAIDVCGSSPTFSIRSPPRWTAIPSSSSSIATGNSM
ncbi:MAG: YaeQ family protein [Nitrospirota bacterium]|nr:YaeQ family protein [Nitrospirota bacterium]